MSQHMAMITIILVLTLCWRAYGLSFDKLVANDGSGDFLTIMDAISAAPSYSRHRYNIKIKAGTYRERVQVGKEKTNIALIGAGAATTIITGNRSTSEKYQTYDTGTVVIQGQGFIGTGLTIQNTAGPYKDQAVALMVEAEQSAFFKCRFEGYQDTLYTKSGSQFFRDCEVYGTVDFIFGSAAALFQNCWIYARKPRASQSNTVTAHKGESRNRTTGIVLQTCIIVAALDLEKHGLGTKTYLGRPWNNFSTTVVMTSVLGKEIDSSGWLGWEGRDISQVYYAEYRNQGPGVKGPRVPWAKSIDSPREASKFTARYFIRGEEWIPSTGIPFFLDLEDNGSQ